MITVTVNDQSKSFADGTTVAQMLVELGLGGRQGIAVAINGDVVSRSKWPVRVPVSGESIILIQATQGG